jgi:hypothetical protein
MSRNDGFARQFVNVVCHARLDQRLSIPRAKRNVGAEEFHRSPG